MLGREEKREGGRKKTKMKRKGKERKGGRKEKIIKRKRERKRKKPNE
jgi:hypothetical protein